MSDGVLIDTCIVIDHLAGALSSEKRKRLDEQPKRYVSVITAWECELKPQLRKMVSSDTLGKAFKEMGARVLTISLGDVWMLAKLERFDSHRDPFDRMLIAQAYAHKLAISTRDSEFGRYRGLDLI